MRAETGTMKFEGDWRGVFIRGDNAFGYALALKSILTVVPQIPKVPTEPGFYWLQDEQRTSRMLKVWRHDNEVGMHLIGTDCGTGDSQSVDEWTRRAGSYAIWAGPLKPYITTAAVHRPQVEGLAELLLSADEREREVVTQRMLPFEKAVSPENQA